VLAATLAGLRSLRITELTEKEDGLVRDHFGEDWEPPKESYRPVQLQCVAHLISSCSGLTQLVLELSNPERPVEATSLHGLWAAAAEEGQEVLEQETGQGVGAAPTAGTGQGVLRVPPLRHLEIRGEISGVLPTFLDLGGASSLTSCKMAWQEDTAEEEQLSLAACSGLQELQLEGCTMAIPEQLLHNSALTKLVLDTYGVDQPLLCSLCVATQLRHLDLQRCHADRALLVLPPDLSSLQQLTCLDVSGRRVEELPQQLGQWLPQLQVLGVENTKVAAIPTGLQRLTCLRAANSSIPSVAAVQHLVGLQQLQLHGNPLVAPYQQLSVFIALQELTLSISEGGTQVVPTPLPLLRVLRIQADDPWKAGGQLAGPGCHLTSLGLYSTWRGMGRVAAVGQLGVLPLLQQLVLVMPLASLRAAGPWLLQQPQLTSLSTAWSFPTGQSSHQSSWWPEDVPGTLQQWCLSRGVVRDGLPEAFTQLTGLRVLRLSGPCTPQLPAWVSCLRPLTVLQLGEGCILTGNKAAWAVLGHMPSLRRVEAPNIHGCLKQLWQDAPHLFRGISWHIWYGQRVYSVDSGWRSL
jgi:hypothetical protein